MITETLSRHTIVSYLDNQNPTDLKEIALAFEEVNVISRAMTRLIGRLNIERQVKLLEEETDALRIDVGGLESLLEQAVNLSEEHLELKKQRDKLQAEQEFINNLTRQKELIAEIKQFVANHDIPAMQAELQNLQNGANGDLCIINQWLNEADSIFKQLQTDFTTETKGLLLKIEVNRQLIDETLNNIQEITRTEDIRISKILVNYKKELAETEMTYNTVVRQLKETKEKLLEMKENHSRNIKIYQLHLSHNKKIFGELGKRHSIDTHVEEICRDIETSLERFDCEIKSLIEKAHPICIA